MGDAQALASLRLCGAGSDGREFGGHDLIGLVGEDLVKARHPAGVERAPSADLMVVKSRILNDTV